MEIKTIKISIESNGNNDITNLTARIKSELQNVKMKEGNVTIFTQSSTSAISIMEYERGLVEDLPRILDMAVPEGINYSHNEMNSDDNGSGHIRSVLIGPSLTVPFSMGELLLGTWQSIIYVDFNTVSSKRSIILQFTGQ